MPWYYIEVHSGGGHQCTTSKWTWRETPAKITTSEDIENFCEPEFDGYYFGGDSAIFHVKKVSKLPVTVYANMQASAKARMKQEAQMLVVLNKTPTHPPRCTLLDEPGVRCRRAAGHKGRCDTTKRPNREKFGTT